MIFGYVVQNSRTSLTCKMGKNWSKEKKVCNKGLKVLFQNQLKLANLDYLFNGPSMSEDSLSHVG